MISFFFAAMVALTMNATEYVRYPNNIVEITELEQLYENNTLVGYRYGAINGDYQDYNNQIWISNEYNKMDFYLDSGLEPIGFEILTTVYNYQTNSCAADLQFKVLGESISTNIYLTNIVVYTTYINSQMLTFDLPSVYFRGQSTYYEDNESGDFTIDLPNDSFSLLIQFDIRTWSVESQEGTWYNSGYNDGFSSGYTLGNQEGFNTGYNTGYTDGYSQGYNTDSTIGTIFSGILQIALVPINFFLAIFNFEILGINVSGFISALLTIALTIIVIRTIFGGKGGNED